MAEPTTRAELIDWFSDRGTDMISFGRIVANCPDTADDIIDLWDAALKHNFCGTGGMASHNAWISRSGMRYSCLWGMHEQLLDFMRLEHHDVELAGWVRVSGLQGPSNVQGFYRPTGKQMRMLRAMGALEHVRADAVWVDKRPPEDMPVISAYE